MNANKSDNDFSINLYDTPSRVADAKKFLDLLFGAVSGKRYSYLWLKNPTQKGGGKTIAYCVTDSDARERMAKDAIRICDEQRLEVYVGVNCTDEPSATNVRSTTPSKWKDGRAPAVTVQTATVTDIDAVGGSHVNHVDKQGRNIVYLPDFDTAKSLLPFQLSLLINSGYGGLHGYALYREPIVITADNDKPAEDRNKKFIDVIQHRSGIYIHAVDSIHDLPRVLRVVGTRNYKGGVSDDAPFVRFGEINDVRFSPEELDEKIATFMPAPSPTIFTPTPSTTRKPQKQKVDPTMPEINFSHKKHGGKFSEKIRRLMDNINANITDADLLAKGYLEQSVNGEYCCPWCDSGHGEHQSGACHYYADGSNSHFTCFSLRKYPKSHGGDIIAFLAQIYEMQQSGKEFFDLLKRIADDFSIPYDEDTFKTTRKTTEQIIEGAPVNLVFPADVTLYGNEIQLVSWKFDKTTGEQVPSYFTVARTIILPSKKFCDLASGKISYEVSIHLPNGQWKRADADKRTLLDPSKIYELTEQDADVASPKGLAQYFSKVLSLPENDERIPKIKVYNRPGWHGDQFIYPTPAETDNYRVERSNISYTEIFATKGNATEWLEMFKDVTDYGKYSDDKSRNPQSHYVRFAIGLCLVAPMLKVIGVKNIQVDFHGTSNYAKTLAPKIGLSVFGDPSDGKMLRTWNSSENNRLAMALGFCDFPILVDEGESMSKKTRETFFTDSYIFFTGITDQKNKRNGDVREAGIFRGVRTMTAESPMHTDTDKKGAFKRFIDFPVRKQIFDDSTARDLHLFVERNFGHYGRKWCNYIVENRQAIRADFNTLCKHFEQAGFGTNFNPIKFDTVDPTNARSVIAAATAFYHFLTCLKLDKEFDMMRAIVLAEQFLRELPTQEEMSDVKRSIDLLASWINQHEDRFQTPRKADVDDRPIEGEFNPVGTYAGAVGMKFADGSYGFFTLAFRDIVSEIGLPSYKKFLNDLYELGALICKDTDGKKSNTDRFNGKLKRYYHIKADVLFPKTTDD